jgi:hypothetical protein
MINRFIQSIAIAAILLSPAILSAQCLLYPVSFNERVNRSQSLLLGTVTEQHCYADEKGNIYTSNKISVTAWIKNHSGETEVYVITLGGMLDGKMQVTYPAVQLEKGKEYFLMLENNNLAIDDKNLRAGHPGSIQALPFADAQGAWLYQGGKYIDVFTGKISEADLLRQLASLAGLKAVTPGGSLYTARTETERTVTAARTNDGITSFSPNPTNAGTVNPADYLNIIGTGFGSIVGSVEFPNADNGGAGLIAPPNTSDYVSWSDNLIVVKVPTGVDPITSTPTNAGTGTFRVTTSTAAVFNSPSPLTVAYSHISINSSFNGFSTPTRQRYYLRNLDGAGGYTFGYNTNFVSNAPAIAAFERALNTWKCNTGINWRASGTTTNGYADDGVNTVLFESTLTPGVLARATSRFNGSAIPGTCDLFNTVWWLKDIDVQVQPSVNWQYGPALATGSQYDFETVLLHELGHAHGLGHRIAPGQLMHYALANAANIRTPAPAEIQGGQAKVAYSILPTCFNPTNSGSEMIVASCPLPLKLLGLTGALKTYGVDLDWKTLNEVNTGKFEVQRSTGGEFSPVGTVAARGNTTGETGYRFTDVSVQQGISYYRLKMLDKDGSYEYSGVVKIKVDHGIRAFTVYPNPVRDELQVSASIKARLDLIDFNGKLVKKIAVDIGSNKIDVSNISSGIYYLADPAGGTKIRIIIMH